MISQNTKTEKHNMVSTLYKLYVIAKSNLAYLAGISGFAAFIMPLQSFLILSVSLVISDTFSGILAAKKRGEKITSRGFYRILEKITVYFAAILCAAGIQKAFIESTQLDWFQAMPLVYIVAGSIFLTEFLSLRENIESLTQVDILGGLKKNIKRFLDAIPKKEDLT